MRTGRPLLNRVEPCFKGFQLLDWFITSKLPLYGKGGKIIGIMGLTHSYEGQRGSYAPFRELAKAMDCIRRDLRGKISLDGLARASGMSQRQLNRKFHAAFGMTPYEFIQRTRIQAALAAFTQTDRSIAEIAADCGFCDQSSFTREFRKRIGTTPAHFRRGP